MIRRRSFWVILLITALVGLASMMAERSDYPLELRVEWEGFDTAACVIEYADTTLPLVINSNCFLAIGRYFDAPELAYTVSASHDTVVAVNKPFLDDVVASCRFPGQLQVTSLTDELTLRLSKRSRKAFVPQLKGVEFKFDAQHGLSGEPRVTPDTVWLYGTDKSLSKVDNLYTSPAVVDGLVDSGYRSLPLAPVWKRYPDLHVSHSNVQVYVPVERFTEKTVSVPVQFLCADKQVRARLYPERVDVSFWVSTDNYDRLLDDMVHAVVQYNPDERTTTLPVRIRRFPGFARIKSVNPPEIQYVVLK